MSIKQARASSLRNWTLGGVSCVLLIGLGFYVLFHLGFAIPLATLKTPYEIIAVLTFLLFPGMFWANKSFTPRNDNLKRRILVLGPYTVSTSLIGIHYVAKAGVMPIEDVTPLSIIMTIGLAISFASAYYILTRIDTQG